MKKTSVALAVMERSDMFGLKAKDMLFSSELNTHDFFRGQNSNICFADGEYQSVNSMADQIPADHPSNNAGGSTPEGDDTPSAEDNTPPENNELPADNKDKGESRMSEKEAQLLKEVMKWKGKAKTAQQELDNKGDEKNPLSDIVGDMSAEDLKALIDAKKSQDRQDREARGEYDSIVTQMKDQHTTDLAAKDKIIGAKDAEIKELKEMLGSASHQMEEMTVGRQFSESLFIKDRATLPPSIARQLFGTHFEVEEGKIVGYDKPRGTEGRAPLVNGQAETLGFEAAIERLITSHPESKTLIRSTMKPGSGSQTTNDDKGIEASKKMSGADRIRMALEK